jgi:hypothetical protein
MGRYHSPDSAVSPVQAGFQESIKPPESQATRGRSAHTSRPRWVNSPETYEGQFLESVDSIDRMHALVELSEVRRVFYPANRALATSATWIVQTASHGHQHLG